MAFTFDYETRSELILPEVGLDRYASHPSTRILLAAFAHNDDEVSLWESHKGPAPPEFLEALEDTFTVKESWNFAFERAISKHCLGVDIALEDAIDTMVSSRYMSLPGKLELVCEILKLPPSECKLDADHLKKMFCEPTIPARETLFGHEPAQFHTPESNPREWAEFCEYCKRDVVAERAIARKLERFPVPEQEWRAWRLSEKINERGFPCRLHLVRGMLKVAAEAKQDLGQQLQAVTGLTNTSNQQMVKWLAKQGYPFNSVAKPFVTRALAGEGELTPLAKQALTLRGQTSKTGDAKLGRLLDMVGTGDSLRHQFSFYGAARTGRFSGGGGESKSFQPQNLQRPVAEFEERSGRALELLEAADYKTLAKEFKEPLGVLGSGLRSCIQAPAGYNLVVADLASIENRVLGWMTGCDAILEVFRLGHDPYLSFACSWLGHDYAVMEKHYKAYKKAKKEGRKPTEDEIFAAELRTLGKAPVLACFGAETPVLTNRGWISIVTLRSDDLLFDGQNWVGHEGLLDQGKRDVIDLYGVKVTEDHKILTGETWSNAGDVSRNGLIAKSATDLANGKLSEQSVRERANCTTFADARGAAMRNPSTVPILNLAKQSLVFPVPTNESAKRKGVCISSSQITTARLSTVWPTDTTQSSPGAPEKVTVPTVTQDGVLRTDSKASEILSDTPLLCPVGTIQNSRSTDATTTVTTKQETCSLFLLKSTIETSKTSATSSGTVNELLPKSSGNASLPATENRETSPDNSGLAFPPSKSSPTNLVAKVNTYDVLNVGTLNRYMILTEIGPMLVHNCGYGLSAGEEKIVEGLTEFSGLMKYARNMGIEMTYDQCHEAVPAFRKTYREVPQAWKLYEEAAKKAIGTPNRTFDAGKFAFECHQNVLCFHLPSGRALHYLRPKVERSQYNEDRWEITYEGFIQVSHVWGRISTSGPKLTENADQGLSRDLLVTGMTRAEEEQRIPIVLHAHDELVGLGKEGDDTVLSRLIKAMTDPVSWCPDVPLAAEGYVGKIYAK